MASKKLQQLQIHLNVPVLSETRLRRGTSLFTLKLCTLAITKPGYPLQAKGFGRLMHSCPLFTAQTTLSKTTLHFNSLRVWQAKHMKGGGSFKAESRSIVCIGGGDWAMKTYAFLGLIVTSQLSLSLPLPLYEGKKFPYASVLFLLPDLCFYCRPT